METKMEPKDNTTEIQDRFNEGWWNCFTSLVGNLNSLVPYSSNMTAIMTTLSDAGVTEEEAEEYLRSTESCRYPEIKEIIHDYLEKIK